MDRRLLEAALRGNVGDLFQLLREDPLLLHAVAVKTGETPLHVASMAGHLDFVKEIIRLKPEFLGELNQEGFSPMHLASANGYLEIVRELLKSGPYHCHLKSKDRRTALHFAVLKGRIEVINELVSSCPESVEDVTIRGETAFHLAVMNYQIEAFKVLVERVKQLDKVDMLNWKDELGNTALHQAICTKQREVIAVLLCNDTVTSGIVEVNSMNRSSLTALDVLQVLPTDAEGCRIEKILLSTGAKRAQEIVSPELELPATHMQVLHGEPRSSGPSKSPLERLVEYFKFHKGRDSPSDARSILLVIAVLITTATYQAGLSPPGGVWQDNANGSNTTKAHIAGKSILATENMVLFAIFLFCNSTGFYVSLFITQVLTHGFPLRLELQICMVAMTFTYAISMVTISPYGGLTTMFHVFSGVFPLSIPFIAKWVRQLSEKWRCANALKCRIHICGQASQG